jgi:hypothetical protein
MRFKENKWHNFGDVNPRIHGGVFIKRCGDDIEVVSTDNLEEVGDYRDGECPVYKYSFNQRTESVEDLLSQYERFKQNPDKNRGVGNSCDWKRYIKLEAEGWELLDIVMYLASDMILYFGSACEIDTDSNYWSYLKSHGITPNNYQ